MGARRHRISPQVSKSISHERAQRKGKGMIIRILNWCPTLELGDLWGSSLVVSKLYT